MISMPQLISANLGGCHFISFSFQGSAFQDYAFPEVRANAKGRYQGSDTKGQTPSVIDRLAVCNVLLRGGFRSPTGMRTVREGAIRCIRQGRHAAPGSLACVFNATASAVGERCRRPAVAEAGRVRALARQCRRHVAGAVVAFRSPPAAEGTDEKERAEPPLEARCVVAVAKQALLVVARVWGELHALRLLRVLGAVAAGRPSNLRPYFLARRYRSPSSQAIEQVRPEARLELAEPASPS